MHVPSNMGIVEEAHFEDTFRGYLGSLKHTLLSCTNSNFNSEKSVGRAHELVKDDIGRAMEHLSSSSSSNSYSKRVAALSFVGTKLLGEVEELQNCLTLQSEIDELKSTKKEIESFYQKREIELNKSIAIMERKNSYLEATNKEKDGEISTLAEKLADTERELELRNAMDNDAHEKFVKLHMDIMTYHSQVKNKVDQSMHSIKARIGFIPREVEQNLRELKKLKPPGSDMVFGSCPPPPRKKQATVDQPSPGGKGTKHKLRKLQ